MFAMRGAVLALSVFALVYCGLSVVVLLTWRKLEGWTRRQASNSAANWLFGLRLLPFVSAVAITTAFTVPSFILFEPRSIYEPIHPGLVALAVCGIALGLYGTVNAAAALRKASRAISMWIAGARLLEKGAPVPLLRIARAVPAMTAAGILHPKILISGAAEFVLTENEMQVALNHEVAHVRRRDNLKKLALRFVTFPGMHSLESAWLEATEMAADDAAVSSTAEALDLAAALIKLSRLASIDIPMEFTAAIVTGPLKAVNARIERLVAWDDAHHVAEQRSSFEWAFAAGVTTIVALAITYGHLLARVHTVTEWLVQ